MEYILSSPSVPKHVDGDFPLVYAIPCSIRHNPKGREYLGFVIQQIRIPFTCGGIVANEITACRWEIRRILHFQKTERIYLRSGELPYGKVVLRICPPTCDEGC
jgi:hypothetical protein